MSKEYIPVPYDLAKTILERDEFTCTECGRQVPKVLLYIDKILSSESEEALGKMPEEDKYTCLCEECYKKRHGNLQFKPAHRPAEIRKQLNMMLQWRESKADLKEEIKGIEIAYIESLFYPYGLKRAGRARVAKAVKGKELTLVLDCIDDTFERYVEYDNDENITISSALKFLEKLGGCIYIKSLPPIEQKIYHICNVCRKLYSDWDQETGKGVIYDYVKALREQGWDDERILTDLNEELLPESRTKQDWLGWYQFIQKWISDINGWKKETSPIQPDDEFRFEVDKNELPNLLQEKIQFAREDLAAFKYLYDRMGGSTDEWWEEKIVSFIEESVFNFLIDQRTEYARLKGIPVEPRNLTDKYINREHMRKMFLNREPSSRYDFAAAPSTSIHDFPDYVRSKVRSKFLFDLLEDFYSEFHVAWYAYDYPTSLKALDYMIKHYREAFDIEEIDGLPF